MLDLDEEPQQQQQQQQHLAVGAAAGVPAANGCMDAAVQTDGERTESAGSTAAAAAAAGVSAAAGDEDDALSPQAQQLRSSRQAGSGGVAAWCEGAAGSALLSAARQEIMRLQELNQQLLQSHAEGGLKCIAVCICLPARLVHICLHAEVAKHAPGLWRVLCKQ
jgi:hypothetical protein